MMNEAQEKMRDEAIAKMIACVTAMMIDMEISEIDEDQIIQASYCETPLSFRGSVKLIDVMLAVELLERRSGTRLGRGKKFDQFATAEIVGVLRERAAGFLDDEGGSE
jgi:hypothetical protein